MKHLKIKSVYARQLIDCKRRPVVEVDVITEKDVLGRGCAPTGSSVGMYESYVLRDKNLEEYEGMSVHKAIDNVTNILAPAIIGMDVTDQRSIDSRMIELDGTLNKANLGGNAIYATSVACIRAAAAVQNTPLYKYIAGEDIHTIPMPSFNCINGGRYGEINLAYNEIIMVPYRAVSIEETVEIGVKFFKQLGKEITKFNKGIEPAIGRSFGWASPSDDPMIILELMQQAAYNCRVDNKIAFAIDGASSEQYDKKSKTYFLKGNRITSEEMIYYTKELAKIFNFVFIEDLLDENDWDGFVKARREIKNTYIIGDDLTVTNPCRLKVAYEKQAIDGFIFKPNQVGTITEAIDAHSFAENHGMLTIPSGRSGGVVGDVVSDLSVGLQVKICKTGVPRSGERIDKINFLLRASNENPKAKLVDWTNMVRF